MCSMKNYGYLITCQFLLLCLLYIANLADALFYPVKNECQAAKKKDILYENFVGYKCINEDGQQSSKLIPFACIPSNSRNTSEVTIEAESISAGYKSKCVAGENSNIPPQLFRIRCKNPKNSDFIKPEMAIHYRKENYKVICHYNRRIASLVRKIEHKRGKKCSTNGKKKVIANVEYKCVKGELIAIGCKTKTAKNEVVSIKVGKSWSDGVSYIYKCRRREFDDQVVFRRKACIHQIGEKKKPRKISVGSRLHIHGSGVKIECTRKGGHIQKLIYSKKLSIADLILHFEKTPLKSPGVGSDFTNPGVHGLSVYVGDNVQQIVPKGCVDPKWQSVRKIGYKYTYYQSVLECTLINNEPKWVLKECQSKQLSLIKQKKLFPNEFVQQDDNKHDDAKDPKFYAKYCDPRFGVVDFANDKKYKEADYKAKVVTPHNNELKTKYGIGPYYTANLRYMFRHNVYSLQYQGCKDGNKYYAPNTIAKIVLPTVDKSEGYALFCQSEPDNNFIAAYKVLPCVYFGKEYTLNSTFVYGHDYLQCFLDGKVKKLGCQYRKSKPIVLAGDKVMIDEETMLHCERFASGYFVTYNPAKCEDDLRNELSYGSVYEGSTGLYRCSGKSIGLARGTLKVTNCVYSGLFIPLNQCVHIGRGVYYRCLEDVYGQPQLDKSATYQDCRHEQRSEIAYSNGDFRADRSFYPTQQVLEKSSLAPLLPKHKVFLSTRTEETIERYERIREKDYYLEDDYYEEIIIHRHHGKGRSKHNSTTSTSSSSGGSSSKEDRESDSQESDEECSYDDEEGGRRESIDSEEDSSSSSQRTSDSTEEIIDETIIDGKGKGKGKGKGHGKHGEGDGDDDSRGSSQTSSGGDDVHSHGQGPGTGSSSEDDGDSHGRGHGPGGSSEDGVHSRGKVPGTGSSSEDDGDSHGSGGSHENGEPRGKSGGEGSTETFQGGGKSGGDCDQVRGGGNDGDDDNDSPGTSGSGDGGSSSTESGGDDHSPEDDKIKPHGDDDISYCSGETGGGSGGDGSGESGSGGKGGRDVGSSEYIDPHSHEDGKGGKEGRGDGSSSGSNQKKPGHGHGGGTSSESRENRGTPVILPPAKSYSSEEYGHPKPPSKHPDSSSQQKPPKSSSSSSQEKPPKPHSSTSSSHKSTKRPPDSSSSHEVTKKPRPSKPSHLPHHTELPDATTKRPCRSKPDPTCPMCKICKRKNNDEEDQEETRTRGSITQNDQLEEEKSSRSRKTEDDQVEETKSEEQRRISGGQTITKEKIVMVNGKKVYHKTKTASKQWPNNGEGQGIDENSLKFSGENNMAGGENEAGEKRIVIRTITKKHSTKKEKSKHKKKKSKHSKHTEVAE